MDWDAIRAEVEAQLDGVELDCERVEDFGSRIADGRLSAARNVVDGDPRPAAAEDVDVLEDDAELEALGRNAIERGEVAVAVLNGGMATRFGGKVKGIVEAIGGRSFLEIKLGQAQALARVPFLVMNSFATQRATLEFLAARGVGDARSFLQSVSLRLTPEGELFRDASGRLSPYAPGHGDFPSALRDSRLLGELEAEGVRMITLSNVDNLGAELDPRVIGHHLARGRPLTCEVAEVFPGDVGGSPAHVADRLQIVEGFRFPKGFDFGRLHFLATNSFVFSLEALSEEHPLSWFYVEKSVEGRPAVQVERLVNELSACLPTTYLAVPRGGAHGRFFPVKTRGDLDALQRDAVLQARFGSSV